MFVLHHAIGAGQGENDRWFALLMRVN